MKFIQRRLRACKFFIFDGLATSSRGGVFGDFWKKRRAAGWVKKSRMFEGSSRVRDFISPPPGARKSSFSAGAGSCDFIILLLPLLLLFAGGCATVPYEYGIPDYRQFPSPPDRYGQIERGRPQGFIDGIGNYFFSLPSKLILWDRRVDNHHISGHTEETIREYLDANRLSSVKVRLNQYAPGGEWIRLARNRDMPGFFRWTIGALTVSLYTILPGRIFGGDNYNPYTNTVSIYSDLDAIALHEAAHARDFAVKPRGFRGWYGLMRLLPLAPLYQEARASGDAIGYCIDREMNDTTAEAYRILYPAYMTYVAGEPFRWLPAEAWMSYAAEAALALPGHVVGRIKAAGVEGDGKAD